MRITRVVPRLAVPRVAARRLSSESQKGRTLIGVSAGLTFGAVSGTIIAWPAADLLGAPYLIARAARQPWAGGARDDADARAVTRLLERAPAERGAVCVLAGGAEHARAATARAVARERGGAVVRVSLREATDAHTLQMALIEQLYGPLPGAGQLVVSMGLYWVTLFDLFVSDHAHVRRLNFAVVLAQLKRGLRVARDGGSGGGGGGGARRPLLVIEHLNVPAAAAAEAGGADLAPMLRALRQFVCAVAIDEALADVLVLSPRAADAERRAAASRWPPWRRAEAAHLRDGATASVLTQSESIDAWFSRDARRAAAERG